MISPYQTTAKPCVISGRAGTGKTEEIVRRAASLVKSGTPSKNIAIFAATKSACEALSRRLAKLLDNTEQIPLICTLFEYELSVLATPQAVERTGRSGRMLMRFEENILMEDMKTSQVHPKRLREMLRFFYKSWAELEPMDSKWFYSDEEENAHVLLKQYLNAYGAYLKPEVARAAWDYLAGNPSCADQVKFGFVFVDDYQTLSKASQCCASLLARDCLCVAADELAAVTTFEEFPYPRGFSEFVRQNPNCEIERYTQSYKSSEVIAALNALLSDSALDSAHLGQGEGAQEEAAMAFDSARLEQADEALANTCLKQADAANDQANNAADTAADNAANSPSPALWRAQRAQDEFENIAAFVQHMIADENMPAERIALVAPQKLWANNLARALERAHIPVCQMSSVSIGGDARHAESSKEGRVMSLLRLMANPQDQLALRCWCGFGDYLANSSVFARLAEENLALSLQGEVLDKIEGQNALIAQECKRVRAALAQARSILNSVKNETGASLVRALCEQLGIAEGDPAKTKMLQLIEDAPEQASASVLCDVVSQRCLLPHFSENGVRIGLAHEFVGLNMQVVIMTGFVNGFVPERNYFDPTMIERDKRPGLLVKELHRTYAAAGKAGSLLAFSYFTEAPLPDAERLKLKIYRVRLRGKERVCEVHPSEVIRTLTGEYFDD